MMKQPDKCKCNVSTRPSIQEWSQLKEALNDDL